MCTNFERSAYEVMKRFNQNTPMSSQQVYSLLCKDKAMVLLGARVTVDDFVKSLWQGNELTKMEAGYILTKLGVRELKRLESIVEKATLMHH